MGRNGLIAGINWAIAATAVAGSIFVISQIFAPITPATWSVGAPDYQVQQLKFANEILPSNRRGMDTSTISQSTSTQVMGQQGAFPKANSADPGLAAGSNNAANQSEYRAPVERYQPKEPPAMVAPASPSPPPSAGAESLPSYMRYF
jgi:hypothetical protein